MDIKNQLFEEATGRINDVNTKEFLFKEAEDRIRLLEEDPLPDKSSEVDPIIDKLEALAPGLGGLAKIFDDRDIPAVPYENRQVRQGPRDAKKPENVDAAKKWMTSIISSLQAPVATFVGSPNFPAMNPALKEYWAKMLQHVDENNAMFPACKGIVTSSYRRKWPDGFGLDHIYPPIKLKDGNYFLDFNRGNLGNKYLRKNMMKMVGLDGIFSDYGDDIDRVYQSLVANNPDHPILKSHTGADNLLFFLQEVGRNGTKGKSLPKDYVDRMKVKLGPKAEPILDFVSRLMGSSTDKNALTYGEDLYNKITQLGEDGTALGYKLAKLLDIIAYSILENRNNKDEQVDFSFPKVQTEPSQASVIDRLVKIADNFDRKGHLKLVDKVDLLIGKLREEKLVTQK